MMSRKEVPGAVDLESPVMTQEFFPRPGNRLCCGLGYEAALPD